MENQHRKITGYRDLTQDEIDLMNRIKALGAEFEAVYRQVHEHIDQQHIAMHEAPKEAGDDEAARLSSAEPKRWAAIAKTDIQTGLMALTRAVAQPTSF